MDRAQILLAEYSEASESCRAQEGYVRNTLNMHLSLSAASAAFLISANLNRGVIAFICLMMAAISLLMALLVLRHRDVYHSFVTRAQKIEAELGMELYRSSTTKLNHIPGEPTAKTLSVFIIGLVGLAYFITALIFVCKS